MSHVLTADEIELLAAELRVVRRMVARSGQPLSTPTSAAMTMHLLRAGRQCARALADFCALTDGEQRLALESVSLVAQHAAEFGRGVPTFAFDIIVAGILRAAREQESSPAQIRRIRRVVTHPTLVRVADGGPIGDVHWPAVLPPRLANEAAEFARRSFASKARAERARLARGAET